MTECSRGCGYSTVRAGFLPHHEEACLYPFTYGRMDVVSKGLRVDDQGCWLWPGLQPGKYPEAGNYRGHNRIHRQIAAWQGGGHLPGGPSTHVCHTCDVKACVNPAHIYVGTPKSNGQDRVRNGRVGTYSSERRAEIMRQTMEGASYQASLDRRRVEIVCSSCSSTFLIRRSKAHRKFCSRECYYSSMRKDKA